MDERYVAAVDLGSSKIAVTVAKIDGNNTQILYYKEHPCRGIVNSAVLNPGQLRKPLEAALDEAENDLKIKILQVLVGLPRYSVTQQMASARIERTDANSCISEEEIEYLKSSAVDSYPIDNPNKMEAFGVMAQSFSADDFVNALENDVVGMVSDTLEGHFKIFAGKKRDSSNIDTAFGDRVAVAKKLFVPQTTAKAVLTHEEMENGVALMEIGGGSSSVTIYKGNIMRYYASVPFGGDTITNDIRTECGSSKKLAENIKLAYGVCMPEKLQNLRDKIIQIYDKETGMTKQLSVSYLSEIITCRMKEIIEALLYYIQESGLADKLSGGAVVTGGSAALPNTASLISELSGYCVRVGYPRRKFSSVGCSGVDETSAATSIGLILAGKEIEHLNCLEEQEELSVKETADFEEENAEPQHEQEPVGELFTNEEVEASAEETKRIKEEKEAQKNRDREERRKKKEEEKLARQKEKELKKQEMEKKFGMLKWVKEGARKITSSAGDLFDSLYEKTEDDQ